MLGKRSQSCGCMFPKPKTLGEETSWVQVCGEHPFLDLDDLDHKKPNYQKTYKNIVRWAPPLSPLPN